MWVCVHFKWDFSWIPVDESTEAQEENWMRHVQHGQRNPLMTLTGFSSLLGCPWDNCTAVWSSLRSVRKSHTSIKLGGRQHRSKSHSTLFRSLEGVQTFLNPELAPLNTVSLVLDASMCACLKRCYLIYSGVLCLSTELVYLAEAFGRKQNKGWRL